MTKELIIDGSHITLQIWDTTGQERFQSLGVAFYRGADACVLVFDLTNIKSYDSIHVWKDEFLNYAAPKNEKEFPFLLMGNKKDLVEYGTMNRAITASKVLKDFPKIEYIETSAKNGDSVESAFNFMGRICAEQIQEDDVYGVFDNTVDLNNTEHLESSMCNC